MYKKLHIYYNIVYFTVAEALHSHSFPFPPICTEATENIIYCNVIIVFLQDVFRQSWIRLSLALA